jgi:amidase
MVDDALKVHDWLEQLEPAEEQVRVSLEGLVCGTRPSPSNNALGAWYWRTQLRETDDGPLAGKTVAVKDNICVAGVPMMNGSAALEGYVPEFNATVVERVLAAGATITGKAVCESLCYSGASHTSDSGPVRNPYDHNRSSGGSSSGCGALLANGDVDLAIGGDQGGSIRCPSSWSGVYGLKPTYGLVPYTGAFPLEMTIDHLGPMARSSADVALLLDVLAGPDGKDPRQKWAPAACEGTPTSSFSDLGRGVAGLRIGVLSEGFAWDGVSEPDVDRAVRAAAESFTTLGATVTEVSVPWHRVGGRVTVGIACEGAIALLLHGEGMGTGWKGAYFESMINALASGRRAHGQRLAPTLKLHAIAGQWMHDSYHGRFYAKAQNASRLLRQAYDDALDAVDLLVLPTTPLKATLLPPQGISATESAHVAHEMGSNTSPFNAAGHPAMNVPCAISEGLPVGMMIVGPHGGDATVLRAAHAFESNVFRPPPPAAGA